MRLLQRISMNRDILKAPSSPTWENISSPTILLKPGKSFVFHREGESQGPWLNYSPPTQFRLICMQAVQLTYGVQPTSFRHKAQITDKSLSRTSDLYFEGTELVKIPPRWRGQTNSQPGMPGLEDGKMTSSWMMYVMKSIHIKFRDGGRASEHPGRLGRRRRHRAEISLPSPPQFLDQSCWELPANGGCFGIRTVCLILPSLTKKKLAYW